MIIIVTLKNTRPSDIGVWGVLFKKTVEAVFFFFGGGGGERESFSELGQDSQHRRRYFGKESVNENHK